MQLLFIYIASLTFGTLYAILSTILGSHGFDNDGGLDAHGDMHIDTHADLHIDGVDHSADAHSPSPLSPVVMASAIATFGAAGIIGKSALGMQELPGAVFALMCAAAVGAAVFFGIVKVLYNSQSNSNFSEDDLINLEAEVLIPIPAKGVGEIVYILNGTRYSIPARSQNLEQINRGEKVIIQTIDNHIAYITRRMTIDDIFVNDCSDADEENKDMTARKKDDNMKEV